MYTNGINVYVASESLLPMAGPDWVAIPDDAALTPAQAARLTKYAGQDAGANSVPRLRVEDNTWDAVISAIDAQIAEEKARAAEDQKAAIRRQQEKSASFIDHVNRFIASPSQFEVAHHSSEASLKWVEIKEHRYYGPCGRWDVGEPNQELAIKAAAAIDAYDKAEKERVARAEQERKDRELAEKLAKEDREKAIADRRETFVAQHYPEHLERYRAKRMPIAEFEELVRDVRIPVLGGLTEYDMTATTDDFEHDDGCKYADEAHPITGDWQRNKISLSPTQWQTFTAAQKAYSDPRYLVETVSLEINLPCRCKNPVDHEVIGVSVDVSDLGLGGCVRFLCLNS